MLVAVMPLVVLWQLAVRAALSGRWRRDERGDVPGWVMIVVMTAAIVGVLTVMAKRQLSDMLSDALNSVTG
jgi:thiol:disulfide interchange protein